MGYACGVTLLSYSGIVTPHEQKILLFIYYGGLARIEYFSVFLSFKVRKLDR